VSAGHGSVSDIAQYLGGGGGVGQPLGADSGHLSQEQCKRTLGRENSCIVKIKRSHFSS
jgi:hypothetical protein